MMARECVLSCEGSRDCILGTTEDDEEGVSSGVDLAACRSGTGIA
jgi:hypothetical protein